MQPPAGSSRVNRLVERQETLHATDHPGVGRMESSATDGSEKIHAHAHQGRITRPIER